MKVAVAGPTGHVGSKLAARVLDAGAETVLLCRDPAKVSSLTARGAKVLAGDLAESEYVSRATRGMDALFWLSPPNFTTSNLHGFQEILARNAAEAIRKNRISRVVNLSSIGAQMPSGTGPVAGLHQVERILNETGASVTHLRAAYFMENYLFSLPSIQEANAVFLPVGGERRIPMVATEDVAQAALRFLLDASGKGQQVKGVHGPQGFELRRSGGHGGGRDRPSSSPRRGLPRGCPAGLSGHGCKPGRSGQLCRDVPGYGCGHFRGCRTTNAGNDDPDDVPGIRPHRPQAAPVLTSVSAG